MSTRSLQHHGQDKPNQYSQQHAAQVTPHVRQGLRTETAETVFEHVNAEEQQAESGQGAAQTATTCAFTRQFQGHAHPDEGQGKGIDLELEADECDQPACHG